MDKILQYINDEFGELVILVLTYGNMYYYVEFTDGEKVMFAMKIYKLIVWYWIQQLNAILKIMKTHRDWKKNEPNYSIIVLQNQHFLSK